MTDTCPGCDEPMEMVGVLGLWHDRCGHPLHAYLLCSQCASVIRGGSDAERAQVAARIEFSLEFPQQGGNG